VTPYIRRAEELDGDKTRSESRLIAYYLRQYAIEVAIQTGAASTPGEGQTTLLAIMDALEVEKVAMAAFSRSEAYFVCNKFAMEIFGRADSDDRNAPGS
jgi:vacuolar protein sorting-associated protein VTA1